MTTLDRKTQENNTSKRDTILAKTANCNIRVTKKVTCNITKKSPFQKRLVKVTNKVTSNISPRVVDPSRFEIISSSSFLLIETKLFRQFSNSSLPFGGELDKSLK